MRLTGGKQAQTPLFALSGTPPEELEKILSPLPRFRAAQILKWIASGISSFDSMGNLPAPLRGELALRFRPRPEAAGEKFPATDGTVKLVLRFGDGARIESVLLNDGRSAPRYTACLSTQAGCPAGCVFCRTGQHFQRSLESAEIVEQFIRLKALAEELSPEPGERQPGAPPVSNIVVMGMGEPLLNLEELRRALAVITCKQGFNFSRRRITVSTCGIPRAIADLADNGPAVRLALSLTTGDEELRRRLMPVSAAYSLRELKESLLYFQEKGGGRVTLEAVLLCGINTSGRDAQGIARFAEGLDASVNLIPWNPAAGLEFEGKALKAPAAAETKAFAQSLEALGLAVTCRFRRGRGVMGACGQLGGG